MRVLAISGSLRAASHNTALLRHALEFLDYRQVSPLTVRLDATPQGRPLYERLGFVEQFEMARYEGTLPPSPDAGGVVVAQGSFGNGGTLRLSTSGIDAAQLRAAGLPLSADPSAHFGVRQLWRVQQLV